MRKLRFNTRTTTSLFGIFLFVVLLGTGCDSNVSGPADGPKGELPRELTDGEVNLIEADQSFSYDIFRRTAAYDDEENIFISPLSISMALAMTLNGAEGDTYEEMRNTLALQGMTTDEINEAFRSLTELLTTADPQVTLKIANSIWHDQNLAVKEDFINRLETEYDAGVTGLDFKDPAAINPINEWVNNNTEGLIDSIVDEIPEEIVMYLINALYFQGDWLSRFDTEDTAPADFHLENGETTTVDMMSQTNEFAAHFSEDVRMIELPYGDSLFAMTILMPASPETPIDQFVQEELTAENLAEWRSNLRVSEVPLRFPKFEMEYELKYNDILQSMGMELPFAEGLADFSGIADVTSGKLYISEVKHKTFIKVDEEGTEAAAVTSVGVGVVSAPPSMTVNRPFVFIIYERESGTNLFMGKVKNPDLLNG